MKKTTSSNLSKRLTQYGALAFTVTGMSNIFGQGIKYMDINPDFQGGIGDEYFLDLDNDGTNDFRIFHNGSETLRLEPLVLNNAALGIVSASFPSYGLPYALSQSSPISATPPDGVWLEYGFSTGKQSLNYGSQAGMCSIGYWCGETDKYLGLRFDISGTTHYGWARLDVSGIGDVWVIKDVGYNDDVDAPINAGEGMPLGIKNNVFSKIKIVALNETIALFNLPQATNYSVYTMTGKLALDGKITNSNKYSIEANTLSTGIYIIELRDLNSNAVVRKKIVL